MSLTEKYQQILDEWIGINREQWESLCEYGAVDGSELNLDYNFSSADENTARGFVHAYEQRYGDAPTVQFLPDDGPGKPAVWSILGTTPPIKTSLKFLDSWVEELVRFGAEHDTSFEGWGAFPPGDGEQEIISIGGAFLLDDEESVALYPTFLHLQVSEDIQPVERGERYDDPLVNMLEREKLGVIRRAGSQCVMEGDGLKVVGFEIVIRVADRSVAEKRVREFMLELGAPSSMTIAEIDDDEVF